MKANAQNKYPYVACIGSPTTFTSAVVICNKKVISEEIGQLVVTCIIVLLSVHFAFDLAYNPVCQLVLEFLQEKFLGAILDTSRKITTAYSNLYRAVNCIEQKLETCDETCDSQPDAGAGDESETQEFCDY